MARFGIPAARIWVKAIERPGDLTASMQFFADDDVN
jgi:hypothetical protein